MGKKTIRYVATDEKSLFFYSKDCTAGDCSSIKLTQKQNCLEQWNAKWVYFLVISQFDVFCTVFVFVGVRRWPNPMSHSLFRYAGSRMRLLLTWDIYIQKIRYRFWSEEWKNLATRIWRRTCITRQQMCYHGLNMMYNFFKMIIKLGRATNFWIFNASGWHNAILKIIFPPWFVVVLGFKPKSAQSIFEMITEH